MHYKGIILKVQVTSISEGMRVLWMNGNGEEHILKIVQKVISDTSNFADDEIALFYADIIISDLKTLVIEYTGSSVDGVTRDIITKQIPLKYSDWSLNISNSEVNFEIVEAYVEPPSSIHSNRGGFKKVAKLISEVTELRNDNRACPCLYLETPCQPNCTCVNKYMSNGCFNCCTYGSLEQRKAMAETLNRLRLL